MVLFVWRELFISVTIQVNCQVWYLKNWPLDMHQTMLYLSIFLFKEKQIFQKISWILH